MSAITLKEFYEKACEIAQAHYQDKKFNLSVSAEIRNYFAEMPLGFRIGCWTDANTEKSIQANGDNPQKTLLKFEAELKKLIAIEKINAAQYDKKIEVIIS